MSSEADGKWVLWVVCGTKRGVTCLSVISWTCFEELRCLFVREGWSEYFLWLWRHSCTRMHLEDTHRWDGACLNIIHSGWEYSREWCDEDYGMWNYKYHQFWVMWVWSSLVNQFTFISSPRIISVSDSSSLNMNALLPIWIEVNSGKSIQSPTSQSITLKHNTRTIRKHPLSQLERFERRHV